jgi:biopolymer transport protein ExbB
MNFGHVFAQGNPVLIAVFMLLMTMSFVSWYLIFWKAFRLRNERKAFESFSKSYSSIKGWPAYQNLKNIEGSTNSLLLEVKKLENILPQYNTHEAKKEILTMHLLQALDEIRISLDKGLTILASIGSSAPFIGLFGTVWGIYGALESIAANGNAGIAVVAGPMGEALIATAIGLFAAIPAVLAYNSFVRLNRLIIQNLRHVAEQMTVYLSNETQKH